MAAAFSAIISVGELVLPEVMVGITEASATRRPSRPRTRSRGDRPRPASSAAHPAGADRVEDRGGDVAGRLGQRRRRSAILGAGPELLGPVLRQRRHRRRCGASRGSRRRRRGGRPRSTGSWAGSPGAPSGSGDVMRTQPRLVGRMLQTLAVKAGNGSSGSPNFGSVSGCTWYWRLGVSRLGSDLREGAELRRRHGHRPAPATAHTRARSRARCTRLWKRSFRVAHAVHLEGAADLQVVLQVLADARQLVRAPRCRAAAAASPGPMPESCRICGEPIAPAARITSRARRRVRSAPSLAQTQAR